MSARYGGPRRGSSGRPKPPPDRSWVTLEVIRETPHLPPYMRKPSRITRTARSAVLALALAMVAALALVALQ